MSVSSYQAVDVPWQYFVTLTFGASFSQNWSPNKQNRLFRFLRGVAAHHRGNPRLPDWRWLVRAEYGEIGGRFHYHALLTDLKNPTTTQCCAMQHLWRGEIGCGWAIVRPYRSGPAAVKYVLKGLESHGVDTSAITLPRRYVGSGANAYELGKYDRADDVMASRGLLAWLVDRANRSIRKSRSRTFYRFGGKRRQARRKVIAGGVKLGPEDL